MLICDSYAFNVRKHSIYRICFCSSFLGYNDDHKKEPGYKCYLSYSELPYGSGNLPPA